MVLSFSRAPLPVPLAGLRPLSGLAMVLFCPGYVLQIALFPRRNGLSGAERLALSVGISLALIPLVAVLLDQLPGEIHFGLVVGAESGMTLLFLAIAWARWHRLPGEVRWEEPFRALSPGTRLSAWLYIGMSGVLTAGLLFLWGMISLTGTQDNTTEFYLLSGEGQLGLYPRQARVGRPVTLTVGIGNRESVPVVYYLEVMEGGDLLAQVGPLRLAPGAVYENPVSFAPVRAGDRVQVRFLLYRDGLQIPYRTLWLWLRVEE
ncbi:MAG: DUF1616 domain-containing protein [Anaerolineae bacterium]|nr:DUF1616 domain-containing protein [Anaerolineae bacterium]MDW7992430.1 DUF1616 domain-containing protein [Anaerolineae bacterium]